MSIDPAPNPVLPTRPRSAFGNPKRVQCVITSAIYIHVYPEVVPSLGDGFEPRFISSFHA
jgi:hypothetical protein